jgi:copper homeostasis protein
MFPNPAVPVALEVIVTTVADALAAEAGGAARVELVRDLDRGGMTPGLALVDAVLHAVRIPVRVMIRETESHTIADDGTRAALVSQARAIGERPVDGLVFGAVAGGGIDEALLDRIAEAGGRPVTFHRAFESLADPEAGIRRLAAHPAVDLVLCDGGPGGWATRAARIGSWTRLSGGGVRVMPGGGVTAEAIAPLAGVREIRDLHVGRLVRTPETGGGEVDSAKVAALVRQLAAARFR